jgi:hypothetical protein
MSTIQQQVPPLDEDERTLVTLNVGGTLYTTTKKTLTQRLHGNQPRHRIQALVEGRINPVHDGNNNIFLDRNGELFKYILDYLRAQGDLNACTFPVNNPVKLMQIIFEAEYFNLVYLVDYFRGQKQLFDNFGVSEGMAIMDEGKALCGVGVVKCTHPCVVNPGVWTSQVAAQANLLHLNVRPLYGEQEMVTSGNMLVVGLISKKRLEQLKMHGMGLAQKDLVYRVEFPIFYPKRQSIGGVQMPQSVANIKIYKENEPIEVKVYFDSIKKSIYKYGSDTKEWKRIHYDMEITQNEEWYFACYCNNNKVMVQLNHSGEDAIPTFNN